MTARPTALLTAALRDAGAFAPGRYPHWEELIRYARESNLLGTLAWRLAAHGHLDAVPAAPRAHLIAARVLYTAQQCAVEREVREIARALRSTGVQVVVLKGAAYLLAELPAAFGRLFSDIDILVPKKALPEVESSLMQAGFVTTHHHAYDQRYYREWMHELPPMQHVKRMTVLDVHHTIVPCTSRIRLDVAALFGAAAPLAKWPGFRILAPADMVLHSATHLFHNEDMTHGLRDLTDLDALLNHFARDAKFWDTLTTRADELDLRRPLHYALRWTARTLGTPVPDRVAAASERHSGGPVVSRVMDHLLEHALRPTANRASTRWARRALYVRGHWLKMPMPMLAWHLTVKTFRREEQPA